MHFVITLVYLIIWYPCSEATLSPLATKGEWRMRLLSPRTRYIEYLDLVHRFGRQLAKRRSRRLQEVRLVLRQAVQTLAQEVDAVVGEFRRIPIFDPFRFCFGGDGPRCRSKRWSRLTSIRAAADDRHRLRDVGLLPRRRQAVRVRGQRQELAH